MKLFYPGQRGGPFGWGVFGENMVKALSEHFEIVSTAEEADVSLIPCADHELTPSVAPFSRLNIGMTFFEYPLGEKAAENAARFDHLFCGSTWNLDRLRERGITNAEVLIQGVDHSIFKPMCGAEKETRDTIRAELIEPQFRIFSGGKFEWRKGQDLVIAAFAEFAKRHADAHLVCSWFNPWPGLAADLGARMGMVWDGIDYNHFLTSLLIWSGIPRDRFTILPKLDQSSLAREMQNTDVGLFPNRCEGGTNLVLMEYAACGKPVVANLNTGHKDVRGLIDFPILAREDENKWADQTIGEIVEAMETAYLWHRDPVLKDTHLGFERPSFTWQAAAKKVAAAVERLAGRE